MRRLRRPVFRNLPSQPASIINGADGIERRIVVCAPRNFPLSGCGHAAPHLHDLARPNSYCPPATKCSHPAGMACSAEHVNTHFV